MKILKKVIISILTIVLIDLISLLIYSVTIEDVLVNGILKSGLSNNLKETIDYAEVENVAEEELTIDKNTFNEILQTDEMKELMNNIINDMIDELASEEIDINNLEIDKELINYLKENQETIGDKIGVDITDEMLEETEKKLKDSHVGELIDKSLSKTKGEMSSIEKNSLRYYQILNEKKTKYFLLIAIIITLILIAFIEKSIYKWIKQLSYAMFISGLFVIISGYSLAFIITSKMKDINVNVSYITNIGYITMLFGALVSILYFVFKKYLIKEDENEISQISK